MTDLYELQEQRFDAIAAEQERLNAAETHAKTLAALDAAIAESEQQDFTIAYTNHKNRAIGTAKDMNAVYAGLADALIDNDTDKASALYARVCHQHNELLRHNENAIHSASQIANVAGLHAASLLTGLDSERPSWLSSASVAQEKWFTVLRAHIAGLEWGILPSFFIASVLANHPDNRKLVHLIFAVTDKKLNPVAPFDAKEATRKAMLVNYLPRRA